MKHADSTTHPITGFDQSRRTILKSAATLVAGPSLLAAAVAADSKTASAASSKPAEGERTMSTVTTKDGTEIYYKDWGPKNAQPIVFHHGWPLSSDDWDTQMMFF
jgi:non-heme chloroperoxidase